ELFDGPQEIIAAVGLKIQETPRPLNRVKLFQVARAKKAVLVFAALLPRVGMVNVNIVDLTKAEQMFDKKRVITNHAGISGAAIQRAFDGLNERFEFNFNADDHSIRLRGGPVGEEKAVAR